MRIYIDENYPKSVFNLLVSLHELSGNDKFKIYRWEDKEFTDEELKDSIFLVLDFLKKGLEIPNIKLFEEGYRTFVCKAGNAEDFSRFGLAMTLFTVWPSILEKSEEIDDKFLYTFNYGGRRLTNKSNKN